MLNKIFNNSIVKVAVMIGAFYGVQTAIAAEYMIGDQIAYAVAASKRLADDSIVLKNGV